MAKTHQKFTGLYLFATIWRTKHVTLSGVAKTDAVPSLKCEERYSNVEASIADLGEDITTVHMFERQSGTGKVLMPRQAHNSVDQRLPTKRMTVRTKDKLKAGLDGTHQGQMIE
jgi:hypothetical protein